MYEWPKTFTSCATSKVDKTWQCACKSYCKELTWSKTSLCRFLISHNSRHLRLMFCPYISLFQFFWLKSYADTLVENSQFVRVYHCFPHSSGTGISTNGYQTRVPHTVLNTPVKSLKKLWSWPLTTVLKRIGIFSHYEESLR
jgi:hypothetical protein